MQSNPASTKASSTRNDISSSMVQPNTLPPNTSGAIEMPDLPSWRLFTIQTPDRGRRAAVVADTGAKRPRAGIEYFRPCPWRKAGVYWILGLAATRLAQNDS